MKLRHMLIHTNVIMAFVSGTLLALIETFLNWGNWQWWPYFMVDYVAAGLLIAGAYLTHRNKTGLFPIALLAVAWAFTAGMAWLSFAGNFEIAQTGEALERHSRAGGISIYVLLIGILFIAASLNAFISLFSIYRLDNEEHK